MDIHQGGIVWFEGLGFDIGARVALVGTEAQAEAQARAGSVVGFDASGPRKGENFIRVLVQPDGPEPKIVALPPASLRPEEGPEIAGLARSILAGLEQSLTATGFANLLTWLTGPEGQALAADPSIRRQRVRVGGMALPGLTLPELVALAAERQANMK
ncbi:MAG: hypothetical protein EI684_07635 [Candidatus Viridilinea halotolerans]|uniref:Uncharacterized protein n=1 Tax=Candidatus Viridilinea halotolerans TaxID=2491704 RepID=A0A426U343_9CHLR|nr:MAG: hypothetical protein EI684_07635 [Candidatus Viridilinea halotolerans]